MSKEEKMNHYRLINFSWRFQFLNYFQRKKLIVYFIYTPLYLYTGISFYLCTVCSLGVVDVWLVNIFVSDNISNTYSCY